MAMANRLKRLFIYTIPAIMALSLAGNAFAITCPSGQQASNLPIINKTNTTLYAFSLSQKGQWASPNGTGKGLQLPPATSAGPKTESIPICSSGEGTVMVQIVQTPQVPSIGQAGYCQGSSISKYGGVRVPWNGDVVINSKGHCVNDAG